MKITTLIVSLITLLLISGTVTADASLTYTINPSTVQAGGTVDFSINVENTGSTDLVNLFTVIYLPKTLKIISTNPAIQLNSTDINNEIYVWDTGNLQPNQSKNVDITAKVNETVEDVIATTVFVFEPIVGGTRQIANASLVVFVPNTDGGTRIILPNTTTTTEPTTTTTEQPITTTIMSTTTTDESKDVNASKNALENNFGLPTGLFALTPLNSIILIIILGIILVIILLKFSSANHENDDKSTSDDDLTEKQNSEYKITHYRITKDSEKDDTDSTPEETNDAETTENATDETTNAEENETNATTTPDETTNTEENTDSKPDEQNQSL